MWLENDKYVKNELVATLVKEVLIFGASDALHIALCKSK